jgi:hypothetical protein
MGVAVSCSLFGVARAATQIAPSRVVLHYSSRSNVQPAPALIRTTSGVIRYALSLYSAGDSPSDLELLLLSVDRASDERNLFYPPGTNLHGLQPWMFQASTFSQGIDKALYGRDRVFRLKWLSIVVESKILKVELERVPDSSAMYEFKTLDVLVTIHSDRH